MNKYILITLYAISVTFLFQYFFPSEKTGMKNQASDIIVSVKSDSLTIPNLPHIEIRNTTASGWIMKPCQDIRITIDSKPLEDIATKVPAFCREIDIVTQSGVTLPIGELARTIASYPGKYILTVKTPVGDRIVTFTENLPGTFKNFFMSAVYDPIYNLFVGLLTFLPGHSLGWAIVIITLVIRLILLVPQHHMLQSQKKLQVIQPKIKEIQKKYKDDQAKLGMEMLDLYKKE